jgi:hypothetical protein
MELRSAAGSCLEDEVLTFVAKRNSNDEPAGDEEEDEDIEDDDEEFDPDLDMEDEEFLDDEDEEDE